MSEQWKSGERREALLSAAIETSGMGVWSYCPGAAEISLDDPSREIHGLEQGSGPTYSFVEFLQQVHPDDRWKLEDVFQGMQLKSFRDVEFRILKSAEETPRSVRMSGSVQNSSGSLRIVGSCFDISERVMVHRQLLQSQKMEAVGQLTAGIAHNFNNILSAILPSLHLVAPHVKPEGTKLIRNAQMAAERATDLVSELMVVAGRKSGQARKAIDVVAIVERVVRICRTTFGGWIQLSVDCDYELPPILGNESQLEQVLLNLLLNARDAFEEASISCPRIDLEIDIAEGQILLRVTDNGPGMNPETLQKIFEPFFTTKGAGTGLGLATVYAIVQDHQGSIECWSTPETGTEFAIQFPVHDGVVEHVPERTPSSFIGGKERILVVDDDALVRRVTSSALRSAGYDVLEAKGGDEAICTHRSDSTIDLVVLDMVMPELTGDQVLDLLRGTDPSVKVLVFTGLSDARVGSLRDVAILQKPAGVNELLRAVRGAIDERSIN